MQEYEHSIFWVPIEAVSQREYDEFGTAAGHLKENGAHSHRFVTKSRCLLFGCYDDPNADRK